jgi:hypothetical protein
MSCWHINEKSCQPIGVNIQISLTTREKMILRVSFVMWHKLLGLRVSFVMWHKLCLSYNHLDHSLITPWEETTHETRFAQFDLYTSKTERYTLYPWEHQQDLLHIQSSDLLGANLCYFVKLFYWRKIVFQSTMCLFSKYKRHSIFQFLQPSLWSTTPILFIKAFSFATSSQFICTFVRWQTVV